LADESATVDIMSFEPVAYTAGSSFAAAGIKKWRNLRSGHWELSLWSSTAVTTDHLEPSNAMKKRVKRADFSNLANMSAPPTFALRTMADVRQEAMSTNRVVLATVALSFDPNRMSQNDKLTYESCAWVDPTLIGDASRVQTCFKKVESGGETEDAEGAMTEWYKHANDGEHSGVIGCHQRFIFTARLHEEGSGIIYQAKFDNDISETVFGMTGNELSEMNAVDPVGLMDMFAKVSANTYHYNVNVAPNGDIASITLPHKKIAHSG
jgi:hypothetical protein